MTLDQSPIVGPVAHTAVTKAAWIVLLIFAIIIAAAPSPTNAGERNSHLCKTIGGGQWHCGSRKYVSFSYQCQKPIGTDGCSTDLKGKLSKKIFGKYSKLFYRACDLHDTCYVFRDKLTCDRAFRANMRAICKTKYKPLRRGRCNGTAEVFYAAVRYQKRHRESWKRSNSWRTSEYNCR